MDMRQILYRNFMTDIMRIESERRVAEASKALTEGFRMMTKATVAAAAAAVAFGNAWNEGER